jgi:hypothetical protein
VKLSVTSSDVVVRLSGRSAGRAAHQNRGVHAGLAGSRQRHHGRAQLIG